MTSGQASIVWEGGSGIILQSATTITGQSSNWQDVTDTDGQSSHQTTASGATYYRLIKR